MLNLSEDLRGAARAWELHEGTAKTMSASCPATEICPNGIGPPKWEFPRATAAVARRRQPSREPSRPQTHT